MSTTKSCAYPTLPDRAPQACGARGQGWQIEPRHCEGARMLTREQSGETENSSRRQKMSVR